QPLEGWRVASNLAPELGINYQTVQRTAETYRDTHPEWFRMYKSGRGLREHYAPALVELIRETWNVPTDIPEGWVYAADLSKSGLADVATIKSRANGRRDSHPEWFRMLRNHRGQIVEHYAPELVRLITEGIAVNEPVPEGWMTLTEVARSLGVSSKMLERTVGQQRFAHPEWFQTFRSHQGVALEYLSVECYALLHAEVSAYTQPPEGWLPGSAVARECSSSRNTIIQIAAPYHESHPEWFRVFRSTGLYEYYAPTLVAIIKEELTRYEPPPPGWMTASGLAKMCHVAHETVQGLFVALRDAHPEWFRRCRAPVGIYEYCSTEVVDEVVRVLEQQQTERRIIENAEFHLQELEKGDTVDAKRFRDLIAVFGGSQAADLLYILKPEFRGIPVERVRSMLGEYLGEVLLVPPPFNPEAIASAEALLMYPDLRQGFIEVIKGDLIKKYRDRKLREPEKSDQEVIKDSLQEMRVACEHRGIENEYLTRAFDDLDLYYREIFERIRRPEHMVDRVGEGREFPDFFQRTNIQAIVEKQRMLIADQMGVGKSASAILAKEVLGIGTAIVVVPKNMIPTWQAYLSDRPGGKGIPGGYFKEGKAPCVVTIADPRSLDDPRLASADYILITQQKMTGAYVDRLLALDPDYLVVDEVHKLKRRHGRHSSNLLRLAEGVAGDGKYVALLSGTPVPNHVEDLAIPLKLLYPVCFSGIDDRQLARTIIESDLLDLRQTLLPRMERKSLEDAVEMPRCTEVIRHLELSGLEREVYEMILDDDEQEPAEKMQTLRQFLLNPELLDPTPGFEGQKIAAVGASLREKFKAVDKVILFVNGYVEGVLRGDDAVVTRFELPEDVEIRTIEGEISQQDRQAVQRDLAEPGRRMLVGISGATGDVGIDLSQADTVVFYNEPWTRYDAEQQLGRVLRPGLGHDLESETWITRGTIEEGMHEYIEMKARAIEKVLRGIPRSELDKQILRHGENQADHDREVNPELAEYYFSSWQQLMKIFAHVKEIGEEDFLTFLEKYGRMYAECYLEMGTRSYQSNASRVVGTLFERMMTERELRDTGRSTHILDMASGPEVLKKHIADSLRDSVVSLDINRHHFVGEGGRRVVGSFGYLPFKDESM
ncbi:MAG: SNF2-related protein, partial [Patescibacteria group bacterium]